MGGEKIDSESATCSSKRSLGKGVHLPKVPVSLGSCGPGKVLNVSLYPVVQGMPERKVWVLVRTGKEKCIWRTRRRLQKRG